LIVIGETFLTGTGILQSVIQQNSPATIITGKDQMFLTGTPTEIHKTGKTNSGDWNNKEVMTRNRAADLKEGRFSKEGSSRLLKTIARKLEPKIGHKGNMLHSKTGNFSVLKTGESNNRTMVMEAGGGLNVIIDKRFFTSAERPFGVFFIWNNREKRGYGTALIF
jgi:hypothetical protein